MLTVKVRKAKSAPRAVRRSPGDPFHLELISPIAWEGPPPEKPVQICFAVTALKRWRPGTTAIVKHRGATFRITFEGPCDAESATSRGILVAE